MEALECIVNKGFWLCVGPVGKVSAFWQRTVRIAQVLNLWWTTNVCTANLRMKKAVMPDRALMILVVKAEHPVRNLASVSFLPVTVYYSSKSCFILGKFTSLRIWLWLLSRGYHQRDVQASSESLIEAWWLVIIWLQCVFPRWSYTHSTEGMIMISTHEC